MRTSAGGPGAAGCGAAVCTAIEAKTAQGEDISMPWNRPPDNRRRKGWGRCSAFSAVACCWWWLSCSFSLAVSDTPPVSATLEVPGTAVAVGERPSDILIVSNVTPHKAKQHEIDTADNTASANGIAAGATSVADGAVTVTDIAAGVDLMEETRADSLQSEGAGAPETLPSEAATTEQSDSGKTRSGVPSLGYEEEIMPQEDEHGSSVRRLQMSPVDNEERKELEQRNSGEAEDAVFSRVHERKVHYQQDGKQKTHQLEVRQQKAKEEQNVEAREKEEGEAAEHPLNAEDSSGADGVRGKKERDIQGETSENIHREAALTFVDEQLQKLEPVLQQQLKAQARPAIFRGKKEEEEEYFETLGFEDSSSGDLEDFTLPSRKHSDVELLIPPSRRFRSKFGAWLTRPLRNKFRSHRHRTREAAGKKGLPQGIEEEDVSLVQLPEGDDSAEMLEDTHPTAVEDEPHDGWSQTRTSYDRTQEAHDFSQTFPRSPPTSRQIVFQNKKPKPLFSSLRHNWETRAVPKLKPVGEKMLTFAQQLLDRLVSTAQPHPYVVVQGQPHLHPQQQQEPQNWRRGANFTDHPERSPDAKENVYDAFFAGAEAAFAAASKSGNSGEIGGLTVDTAAPHGRTAGRSVEAESPAQDEFSAIEGPTGKPARDLKSDTGARKSELGTRRLSEHTSAIHTADNLVAASGSSTSTAADDATPEPSESPETLTESEKVSPRSVHTTTEQENSEHSSSFADASAAPLEKKEFHGDAKQEGSHRRLASYGLNRPPTPMPHEEVEHFPFRGWKVRKAREKFAPVVQQRTQGHSGEVDDSEEEREFSKLAAEADINEYDTDDDETVTEEEDSITEDYRQDRKDFAKYSNFKNRAMLSEAEHHESTAHQEIPDGARPAEVLPSSNSAELTTHLHDSQPEVNGNARPGNTVTTSNAPNRRLAAASDTAGAGRAHSQQSDVVCNNDGKLARGYPCFGVPHYLPPGVDEELHIRQLKLIDEFLERTFGGLPDVFMDDVRKRTDEKDEKEVVEHPTGQGFRRSIPKTTSDEAGKHEDVGQLLMSKEGGTHRVPKAPVEARKQQQGGFERPPTPIPVGYKTFFPSFGDGPLRLREDQRLLRMREPRMRGDRYGESQSEMHMDASESVTEFEDSREPHDARTFPNEFRKIPVLPSKRERRTDFTKNIDRGESDERGRTKQRVNIPRRSRKSVSPFTEGANFSGLNKSAHENRKDNQEDKRNASPSSSTSGTSTGSSGTTARRQQAASPSWHSENEEKSDDSNTDATSEDPCAGEFPLVEGEQSPQPKHQTELPPLEEKEEQASSLDHGRRLFDGADEEEEGKIDHAQKNSSLARKPGPHTAVDEANIVPAVLESSSREISATEPKKPAAQHVQSVLKRRPTPYPRRGRRVPRVPRRRSRHVDEEMVNLPDEVDDISQTNDYRHDEQDWEANMEFEEAGRAEGEDEQSMTVDEEDATATTTDRWQRTNPFMRSVNRGKRTIINALRGLISPPRKRAKREFVVSQRTDGTKLSSHPAADDNEETTRDTISTSNNSSSSNRDTNSSGIGSDNSIIRHGNERRLVQKDTGSPTKENETGTGWMLIPGSRDPRGRPLNNTCVRCEKVVLCLVLFPGVHTIESCSLMYLPEGIDDPYAVFNNKCSPCSSWGTDRPLPAVLSSSRYVRFIKPASLSSYSESRNIAASAADVYMDIDEIALSMPKTQTTADGGATNTSQAGRLSEEDRETIDHVYEDVQSSPETVLLPHMEGEEVAAALNRKDVTNAPAVDEQMTAEEETISQRSFLEEAAKTKTTDEAASAETIIPAEKSPATGPATVDAEKQAVSLEERAELADRAAPPRRLADADLLVRVEDAKGENSEDGNVYAQETETEESEGEEGEAENIENEEEQHLIEQLLQYSSDEEQHAEVNEKQQQNSVEEKHVDQPAEHEPQQAMQQRQLAETETQHHEPEEQHKQQPEEDKARDDTGGEDVKINKDEDVIEEEEEPEPLPRVLQAVALEGDEQEQKNRPPVCPCTLGHISQRQSLRGSPENSADISVDTAAPENGVADTGPEGVNQNQDDQHREILPQEKNSDSSQNVTQADTASTLSDGRLCHDCLMEAQRMALDAEIGEDGDCMTVEDVMNSNTNFEDDNEKEDNILHVPVVLQQIRDHPWMIRALIGLASILGGDLSEISEFERRKKDMTISDLAPAFLLMRRPQRNSFIAARLRPATQQQLLLQSQNQECGCNHVGRVNRIKQQDEEVSTVEQQSGTATPLRESLKTRDFGVISPARLRFLQAQCHPVMATFLEAMAGLLLAADEEQIAQLRIERGIEVDESTRASGVHTLPAICCDEESSEDHNHIAQAIIAVTEERRETSTEPTKTAEVDNIPEAPLPLSTAGKVVPFTESRCECKNILLPRPVPFGKRYLYAVKSRNPLHALADDIQQKQLKERVAKEHRTITTFWEGIAALLKGGAVNEVKYIRKRRNMS